MAVSFKWISVALLGWVCLGLPQVAEAKKKKRSGIPAALRNVGDLSVRFDAGVEVYRLSTASGELIDEAISARIIRLTFNFEYGYFSSDNTTLFVCLPFSVDIDPVVGPSFFLSLGVGARRYFARLFFVDLRAFATFLSYNRLVFTFGGAELGVGAAIPLGVRVRLLVVGRPQFNFIGGFRVQFKTYLGLEALF